MNRPLRSLLLSASVAAVLGAVATPAESQEARRRWERMCEIRAEKFDLILPEAMENNDIDMWVVVMREGLLDPLYEALGRGYVGDWAYYVFTQDGDRVHRSAFGVGGYMLEECGVYDLFAQAGDFPDFVRSREPRTIGVNMATSIGGADGLSHTSYRHLRDILGAPYAGRLVSAERLVSDFRSTRTATEIAAFAEAGEMSREIAERAFSNEVVTPGVTTLEDVAWWMMDQLLERGLGSSFDMPSVYVTGPEGIVATSSDRIIQRGDLMMIDWGVGFLDFYTDMKRIAYVLREGETEAPPGLQRAFDQAIEVRSVMKRAIKPAETAEIALRRTERALEEAGFEIIGFNQPTDSPATEVVLGPHSVGNWGHGIGPSLAFFNPTRMTYELRPGTLISVELFAYTANPEWGGAKVRIPLEDDAVVTARGVEWLYPVNSRILLIK